jgi:hypothetical protein
MALRADPLAGAAEAVAAIERRCGGGRYPDPLEDAGESWPHDPLHMDETLLQG